MIRTKRRRGRERSGGGKEDGAGEDVRMEDGGVGHDPGDHKGGERGHEAFFHKLHHLLLSLVVEVRAVHEHQE